SIEIRGSFLEEIKTKLLNNESFRVYHAGCRISANSIKIKNMEIYNELQKELSKILLDYYEKMQIRDSFNSILLGSILKLLAIENEDKPICYFLNCLSKKIFENSTFDISFVNTENEILELKSSDVFSGSNDEIVSYFASDLSKKVKESNIKVYIIGANEKTKQFEPIPISKFDDDRIKTIVKSLQERTKMPNIEIIKVPDNNNNCILLMVVKNEPSNPK
ncbi:MAG: hypothetical protein QXV29_02535, partial [Candidatus Woesearchaeota archaeon]